MSSQTTQQKIGELFQEAGRAHHQAFIEADGADPDWPIWYAGYLHERLGSLLRANFTQSELTYLLVKLDKEIQATAPGHRNWPDYYARRLLEWYG